MWIQCMRFLLGGGGVGERGGGGRKKWKNNYSTFLFKAAVRNDLAYFSFSEEWVWEIHTLITVIVWLGTLYFYRVMVPCAAFFNDHNWHWASSLIGFASPSRSAEIWSNDPVEGQFQRGQGERTGRGGRGWWIEGCAGRGGLGGRSVEYYSIVFCVVCVI